MMYIPYPVRTLGRVETTREALEHPAATTATAALFNHRQMGLSPGNEVAETSAL